MRPSLQLVVPCETFADTLVPFSIYNVGPSLKLVVSHETFAETLVPLCETFAETLVPLCETLDYILVSSFLTILQTSQQCRMV